MANYYTAKYDNEALGPFVAEGANMTWTGGVGFIVHVIDHGTTGELAFALVSGVPPNNNQTLTQGTTTADVDEATAGAARLLLYPAYFRNDAAVASSGAVTWTGPALGATHSFNFDGQTANVVANEILTFSGGHTCEVITVESDAGASGELSVRFISPVDQGLPADNDTFTGDIAGDGTVNGVVHDRAYAALHIHRLLSHLNYESQITGDDDLSVIDPTPADRSTDQIISLLGTVTITDEVSQHMYGGSVSQASGATLYSGLNIQVTSPNADTQPVVIQNDAIVTDYWKNAYMPHSIDGNIRILRKTRDDGVDIDGKRVRGGLLEFGDSYFFGGTTLGLATTALALFSSTDGNNATAVGTVAGAPYNSIVITEGYQTIDFNNGNGATPFGLVMDYGTASSPQAYERTKYIQRRGTAETLFGRNAQLVIGVNRNFAYDNEAGGPFSEDEIVAWGTVVTYTGQTTNFTLGEVVTFSGGGRGRLIYMEDNVATGTLVFDLEPGNDPVATETMTGVDSGGDGTVGTITVNTTAGTALLIALNDAGATGNLYLQGLTGLLPANNQTVYGSTSNASADVAGAVASRTINNQFIGTYTGTNYQTNFGVAIHNTDAIVGDKLTNLSGVEQEPPNNQSGFVAGLTVGESYTTVNPWDGSSTDVNGDAEPDFDEAALATALVAGVTTVVDVGAGNIPDNTPDAGFLRIERDSDGNYDLVEYSSHDGDDQYTLVGTAPSAAAIANNVMRAFIDKLATATTESFTAIYGPTSTQVVIKALDGGATPTKPAIATATFGAAGFSVTLSPISDA